MPKYEPSIININFKKDVINNYKTKVLIFEIAIVTTSNDSRYMIIAKSQKFHILHKNNKFSRCDATNLK